MVSLVSTGGTGVSRDAIPAMPDLRYRYLRLELQGHPPALLVLGYVEPDPQGDVSVWYTGNQEVLRMQNGRVVAVTGTAQDWQRSRFTPNPPIWTAVPEQGLDYVRERDELQGYRFGHTEQVHLTDWQGLPPMELPSTLPRPKAAEYRWFRESVISASGAVGPTLPDAWFAWGRHRGAETIVYSEQCIAPDFCLKLQPWPLLEEAK